MRTSTLKQDIIEESITFISEVGINKFSVRNLSKRLNVSHNALYKHYKSKQEVFFAIAAVGYHKLGNIYLAISKQEELSYFNRLKECTYSFVQYIVDNKNIYDLMVSSDMVDLDKTDQLIQSIQRTYGILINLAEKSVELGQCNCTSPYSMVNTAWAVGHGLASLIINKQFSIHPDLNSLPVILDTSIDSTPPNIREIIKYTIESTFRGML